MKYIIKYSQIIMNFENLNLTEMLMCPIAAYYNTVYIKYVNVNILSSLCYKKKKILIF